METMKYKVTKDDIEGPISKIMTKLQISDQIGAYPRGLSDLVDVDGIAHSDKGWKVEPEHTAPKPTPTKAENKADIIQRLEKAGYDRRNPADYDKLVLAFSEILAIRGRGALICGSVGCGKTFAISAVTRTKCMVRCHDVDSLKQLTMEGQEHARHDLILSGDLIIDDIGSEEIVVNFGNRQNIVADFICKWHTAVTFIPEHERPRLFLTTNLPITSDNPEVISLMSKYGLRVVDRIAEICDFIEMTGQTNRRKWIKY